MRLRAPFPYFGGKSRVAHLVWPRFGDVANYVEPFAGSLAVLLGRPHVPRVETVNDLDCYLSNFWRALREDPDQVAFHADTPVNEADLHARHRWLVETMAERVQQIRTDPHYFDAQVAGYWVYGQCLWIGSGWCAEPGWRGRANAGRVDRGIHTERVLGTRNGDPTAQRRRPQLSRDQGITTSTPHTWKKRPDARRGGKGVHGTEFADTAPSTNGRRWQGGGQGGGSGVIAPSLLWQQAPDLSGSRGATGRGVHKKALQTHSEGLYAYLRSLSARLRRVRVCCGDWSRILTPSVTTYIGVTGVFLDPPYRQDLRSICYSEDRDISAGVRAWALEHGADPLFRIALCGYVGEHTMPSSWTEVAWKAHGGYSRSARGKANRAKERIWFSPHCLAINRAEQIGIFTGDDHDEA